MADENITSEVEVNVTTPVTISIDIEKLLAAGGYTYDGGFAGPDGYEPDNDYTSLFHHVTALAARQLAERMSREVEKQVTEVVLAEARAQVLPIIDSVINGEIRQTNTFGESTGRPTTLREHIIAAATEQLHGKVDSHGRPTTGYREGTPYIKHVATEAARLAIREELAPEIEKTVAGVKAGITELVSAELADKIRKATIR